MVGVVYWVLQGVWVTWTCHTNVEVEIPATFYEIWMSKRTTHRDLSDLTICT